MIPAQEWELVVPDVRRRGDHSAHSDFVLQLEACKPSTQYSNSPGTRRERGISLAAIIHTFLEEWIKPCDNNRQSELWERFSSGVGF